MAGKRVKKIKVLKYTYDEVSKKGFEDKLNKELLELQKDGREIITSFVNSLGLSPVLLIYTITYWDVLGEDNERAELNTK